MKCVYALILSMVFSGHCLAVDTDLDGIPDGQDPWPNDATRPVVSSLWGVNGENWTPQSRLPFVGFAGYREGNVPLPQVTRIVANVVDFGATGTDGSADDTQAFLDAIAHAGTQVSAANPGVILVPAGVYDVDDQLHLDTSGMILRGEGRDTTTIRFANGLINDLTAVPPGDQNRLKMVVLGGNWEGSNFQTGVHWEQWNGSYSIGLDVNDLPQRGDMEIRLPSALSSTLLANIQAQGNRVRLAQNVNFGDATPKFSAAIYAGDENVAFEHKPDAAGGAWISQQFVVEVSADNRTLFLDRPLRFTPSDETALGGARICVRNATQSWDTEEIGVEHLTLQMPDTAWIEHFGTEGQGGIDVLSDNSWVRSVRVVNADNGVEVDKKCYNATLQDIILDATRVPRRSGPPEWRYDAYGHHGVTLKGGDHLARNIHLNVGFVHDVTMNNAQGCVVMEVEGDLVNMDHHRQGIYSSVWTDISLGNPARMWDSTGNPSEGWNASAFNTYWNILSDNPTAEWWPEDGSTYPQWGYHKINIVGTGIQSKPPVGTTRPAPYDPANAHLESTDPAELWPQNIYLAQREAYDMGYLWAPSNAVPVADALATNVLEDASVVLVLTGSDPEGSNLTYSVDGFPTNGTLGGTAPNLTYTPGTNYFGPDSFTFTVNDGKATSPPATVSITVVPVNDAPVFAVDPVDAADAVKGFSYSATIGGAATDADGDGLAYSKTGGPAWLTIAADGTLGGTPGAGDVGMNSFTVLVEDGNGGSDSATLQVSVFATAPGTYVYDQYITPDTVSSGTNTVKTFNVQPGDVIVVVSASSSRDEPAESSIALGGGTASFDPVAYAPADPWKSCRSSYWYTTATSAGTVPLEVRRTGAAYYIAGAYQLRAGSGYSAPTLLGSPLTRAESSVASISNTYVLGTNYTGVCIEALSTYADGFASVSPEITVDGTGYANKRNTASGTFSGTAALDSIWSTANAANQLTWVGLAFGSVNEAPIDTDGDGLTDAQEIALGTDPNDPASVFAITDTSALPSTDRLEVVWPSATGVLYRIWGSPDLTNWAIVRGWTNALTPPSDAVEIDLSPSNGFFKVEAEIQ